MQGRKTLEDEWQHCFSLSAHMPEHNFYRRLKDRPDLDFLYELTTPYYGRCGQQSIAPVVFFKLCLVAHLENISPPTAASSSTAASAWTCTTF